LSIINCSFVPFLVSFVVAPLSIELFSVTVTFATHKVNYTVCP
jgi:hypothetical protein